MEISFKRKLLKHSESLIQNCIHEIDALQKYNNFQIMSMG